MRPIDEITRELSAQTAFEQTPEEVYRLLLSLIDRRLVTLGEEVWNPRLAPNRYARLRAKRQGMLEIRKMIETLSDRRDPARRRPQPRPKHTPPSGTYGSGAA